MREIKFRGKNIKGNWHYGLLTHDETPSFKSDYKWFISNNKGKPYAYGVIEKTIGQFTGLKDKNGKEIYEGDVVEIVNNYNEATKKSHGNVVVKFKDGSFIVTWDVDGDEYYNHFTSYNTPVVTFEVIGNIHNNEVKEWLLKSKNK